MLKASVTSGDRPAAEPGSLIASRRFAPLFWCQFFSAFNDNFLKNALVFLILFQIGGSRAEMFVTLAAAVFIAPFFFLSGIAGELADRFDKAIVARRLKLAEIGAAAVAVGGFAWHSVPALFVALALFGIVAALFGPIKYGILPDHLQREELPRGNALIEGATFLAILLGTIAGGIATTSTSGPAAFGTLVVGFAVLSWMASLAIPRTGEAAPELRIERNVLRSTVSLLRDLRGESRLWRAGVYTSWFWLVGAVVLSLMPPLVKDALGGSELAITVYLAVFAIGIALGSGLAAFFASGRIILLPTPAAALVMALFGFDLWLAIASLEPLAPAADLRAFFSRGVAIRVAIDFAGIAIGGGLFIVPSFAAVQAWAGADRRARTIAAVNVLNAAFMVVGGVVVALLQGAGVGLGTLIGGMALANLAAAVVIFVTLPTNPFRDFLSILFRAFYRVEVKGLEKIAEAGPNPIIALNHVSFLDGALALSILDREPIFAIDHTIAQRWWVKPFLRVTRAMPLDPTKPMATRILINAVKAGETLVIFPEGRITVTGSLMKVYDGAGLVADKAGVPVVPVRIEGLEATMFSRLSSAQVRRRWFPKVLVTVLDPVRLELPEELKGKARRQRAGAALYQVMSDLVFRTSSTGWTLHEALVEAAALHGKGRVALQDPIAGTLTYKRLLVGAAVLGRKLMPLAGEGDRRHAAERQRRRGDVLRARFGRAGPGDDQLHRGRGEHPRRVQGGRDRDDRHVARLRREGQARRPRRGTQRGSANRLARGCARLARSRRQAARPLAGRALPRAALARRSRGDPLHLGLRRHAEGGRPLAPQHAGERGAGRRPDRLRPAGQGVQRASRLPLLSG
jgi:acyl-[acyl-carrier-protein]-phospholipid O-acyltransferase / long-chain-fatty-acid--[acyl-carrier-protein] ligase